MKNMGYGDNYKYAHSYDNNFVEQEFLPDKVSGTVLYNPGPNARENELREFLKRRWGKKYGY
jgi:putative ATPase